MSEGLLYRLKIAAGRQNAFWADETANLKDQREECGKVDRAERAKEYPARNEAVWISLLPTKEPTDRGRRASVHDRCNYTEKLIDSKAVPGFVLAGISNFNGRFYISYYDIKCHCAASIK